MGLKTKNGSGNCVSTNSVTETIPRKTKGTGKRGGGSPAVASSATRGGDAEATKGWRLFFLYARNTQQTPQILGKHIPQKIIKNITAMAPPNRLILAMAEVAQLLMVTKK